MQRITISQRYPLKLIQWLTSLTLTKNEQIIVMILKDSLLMFVDIVSYHYFSKKCLIAIAGIVIVFKNQVLLNNYITHPW